MAGHSKWATIKRAKAVTDAKRSKEFARISKEITIAARLGNSGDFELNSLLKSAVAKGKAVNMPSDKIQKAINVGLGIKEEGEITYENTYEIYGPGGVAILVDCETDNPARTVSEMKTFVNKSGGKMVPEGSLSWQFKEMGDLLIEIKNEADIEEVSLEIMELPGVLDIQTQEDKRLIKVNTEKEDLKIVLDSIKDGGIEGGIVSSVEIIKIPTESKITLGKEDSERFENFIEKLEEVDDVTNVWSNIQT